MPEDRPFQELVALLRAGDGRAAQELVSRFQPAIRRVAQALLFDARLRRVVGSEDICQSVLFDFFVRVGLGLFDIDTPRQLQKLLNAMAVNKVRQQVDRARARRRDYRRSAADGAALEAAAADDSTPSEHVATEELIRVFLEKMSPEERRIAELRREGRSWRAVGAELGITPEAARKQLDRAIDRIRRELGL
jgi:RNA polymerase sigma factor (sigma-70 family)